MRAGWVITGLLLLGTGGTAAAQEAGADAPGGRLEWVHAHGESAALRLDGETLWRFNFGSGGTHSFFHPLCLPGTGALTRDAPGDHVHHHGLWFCWKYINGVNFWEHAPGSARPAGRTSWTQPYIDLFEDGSALFEYGVSYILPDGTTALRERRRVRVSPPRADGAYWIDWTSEFLAVAERVALDRTPLPHEEGGRVYGGYAGLSVRLAQLEHRGATTLEGTVDFNDDDRYRGRSDAFEYAGVLDGQEVGVAILSHPDNLNAPSPWYAIRTGVMSFFTPAVICYGAHEMREGEAFALRYRVAVHPGRWDAEDLADALGEFVAATAARDEQAGHEKEDPGR